MGNDEHPISDEQRIINGYRSKYDLLLKEWKSEFDRLSEKGRFPDRNIYEQQYNHVVQTARKQFFADFEKSLREETPEIQIVVLDEMSDADEIDKSNWL